MKPKKIITVRTSEVFRPTIFNNSNHTNFNETKDIETALPLFNSTSPATSPN